MKKLYSLLLVFICSHFAYGQSLLPGDMAVLGFNSDQSTDLDQDGFQDARWAVVTLRALPVGTIVHFTDAGFTESGTFHSAATNEGHLTWVVTTSVPAGQVFVMDCVDGSNFADLNGAVVGTGGLSDFGNVSGHLGGTGVGVGVPFGTSGDQIIIYQGTAGTTQGATFVYAYSTQQNGLLAGLGQWQTSMSVTAQNQSYLPTGLVNGVSAVALTTNIANGSSGTGSVGSANYGFDNMIYQGIRTGTRSQLLAAIADPSNHAGNNTTPFPIGLGSGFSIPDNFVITGTLPVSWGNLSAINKGNYIQVEWETLSEESVSHFDIETSSSGTDFVTVKTAIPALNTGGHRYMHTIPAGSQIRYIRIKQIDVDGRYTYSKTITLVDRGVATVQLLNNPVRNGNLQVKLMGSQRNLTFHVFNALGSEVSSKISPEYNAESVSISIGHLPAGTYYLVAQDRQEKMTFRFIKL